MAIGSNDTHVASSHESLSSQLLTRFRRTRAFSMTLAEPLSAEDCAIQSMPDASPTRWHLAHTTWFFETFLLKQLDSFTPFQESFEYLFNSYYNTVGNQFPRDRRGCISRPSLAEVLDYRRHVDQRLEEALDRSLFDEAQLQLIQLGLEHEQQHQELILTDIKHVLGCNPLFPSYHPSSYLPSSYPAQDQSAGSDAVALRFIDFSEGVVEIGHAGDDFAFDNETPRHKSYVSPFALANRCVTNGEYLEFMDDGGYRRPEFWLSMGWHAVCEAGWEAPLYWQRVDDQWHEFTLAGLRPIQATAPVCHVSYFEAEAFARWSGARLPTEFEWETACTRQSRGSFADDLVADRLPIHPRVAGRSHNGSDADGTLGTGLQQMLGDVWEWTGSQYLPYPGFAPNAGAIGEYNGKFMCNQFVLRGGSCATPAAEHIRPTYRNFFPPDARWQFSGIRLCKTVSK